MGVIFRSKKQKEQDKLVKEYSNEEDIDKEPTLIDLLNEKDNDEEIMEYMTDQEKKEFLADKQYQKNFTIVSISVLVACAVVGVIIVFYFAYFAQDDVQRVYKQEMIDYYESRYGNTTKIDDIHFLCHKEKNEEGTQVEVCSDILYSLTSDKKNILRLNDIYADNISTAKYYDEYNKYIKEINPNMDVIWNNPQLSDSDFYEEYYQFIDYITVMPEKSSFTELFDNNKLTIIDIIMYSGELNINNLNILRDKMTKDSKLFFIQTNMGQPISLTAVTKDYINNIKVNGSVYLDNNILNYQLDTVNNRIDDVVVSRKAPSSVDTLDNTEEFTSAFNINISKARSIADQRKGIVDNRTEYFMISMDNLLSEHDIRQYNSSKELTKDKYKELYTLRVGSTLYIIGSANVGIGNITKIQQGLFN